MFRILYRELYDDWSLYGDDEEQEDAIPPAWTPVYDDEAAEPPGREGPAAGRYWCPRCGSDDVIVQEEGPSPVSAGGVLPLDRLKSLARSAGSAWGLRFCRGCGRRW